MKFFDSFIIRSFVGSSKLCMFLWLAWLITLVSFLFIQKEQSSHPIFMSILPISKQMKQVEAIIKNRRLNEIHKLRLKDSTETAMVQFLEESIFNTYGVRLKELPNLMKTSIVRDFIHHYNAKGVVRNSCKGFNPDEFGNMFIRGCRDICGYISLTSYHAYRSLGYDVERLDVVNNLPFVGDRKAYTQSHAFVQVFIPELEKYVIQDATFNWTPSDSRGVPLSYSEVQRKRWLNKEEIKFSFVKEFQTSLGSQSHKQKKDHQSFYKKHYIGSVYSSMWSEGGRQGRFSVEAYRNKIKGKPREQFKNWMSQLCVIPEEVISQNDFVLSKVIDGDKEKLFVISKDSQGEYLFDLQEKRFIEGSISQFIKASQFQYSLKEVQDGVVAWSRRPSL